jgi:hypothetical protein
MTLSRQERHKGRRGHGGLTILESPSASDLIIKLTGDLQSHARELWGDDWKDNLESVVTANSPADMVKLVTPAPPVPAA